MKTASQILDTAFLAAYNNASLTNAQVMSSLDCDWTAIGVKMRSERLALHTTMKRTGGAKGSAVAIRERDLAWEAKFWNVDGTIQEKPNGAYVPLKTRFTVAELQTKLEQASSNANNAATTTTPAAEVAAATQVAEAATAAPVAEATTAAPVAEPVATQEPVKFKAELLNETYEFSGADISTAVEALMAKMRELNFSKVQCTDKRTNNIVGLGDIKDGGSYKFAKQLTAN